MDLDLKQTKINVASKVALQKTETCLPFSNGLCIICGLPKQPTKKNAWQPAAWQPWTTPFLVSTRRNARDWIGFHPAIVAQAMVDIFVAKNPAATVGTFPYTFTIQIN